MKSNWKSCLFAAAALIAVATIHAQSSGTYTVHNLTVGGTATGSFGGGGSGTFQSLITDLKVTRTSGTVLTFAAGMCWDTPKSGTLTATIGSGSGNGSWVAYCNDAGAIVVLHSTSAGLTVSGSGVLETQVTTPAIPEGAQPIAEGTISSGNWATSPTDLRTWSFGNRHISGTGMNVACATGVCTHNVDTAVVQTKTDTATTTGAVDYSGATSTISTKTGTSAPGTCAVGGLFFDTDATAGQNLQGCTATNTWTTLAGGSGYDPMDRTKIQLVDDFASGSAGADKSGALGWWNGNQAGSGGVTAQSPSGDRFGIMRITTGASTNDETQMQLGTLQGRWDNVANWETQIIFRIPSSIANVRTVIGFLENNAGGATANRISIRYDAASDTVFKFETCASSTCTTNSSTVTVAADTWYRGRIRSTSAGTILFSIDGETEVSNASNVPSSSALLPVIAARTATTAAKLLDVDWWAFQRTGLSR